MRYWLRSALVAADLLAAKSRASRLLLRGNESHYLVRFLSTKTQPGKTIKARLLGRPFDITCLLQRWIVDKRVLTYRTDPWVLSSKDWIRKHRDRLRSHVADPSYRVGELLTQTQKEE